MFGAEIQCGTMRARLLCHHAADVGDTPGSARIMARKYNVAEIHYCCYNRRHTPPVHLFQLKISLKQHKCGTYACKDALEHSLLWMKLKGISMCNTREVTE